jgi:hypothetical protein
MKPNETQYQQALKHHESQIGGMVLTACIPNTQRHQGVIQTVQQQCQQSHIHQASVETHKQENSTAQRWTVILRMHDMKCCVIYYCKMKWIQVKPNSNKPSNITRARLGAWYLHTAFQTHKDTKALSKPSNSNVNNHTYITQAWKHTSKKTAEHNGERSYWGCMIWNVV